jgi:hypothetical protein
LNFKFSVYSSSTRAEPRRGSASLHLCNHVTGLFYVLLAHKVKFRTAGRGPLTSLGTHYPSLGSFWVPAPESVCHQAAAHTHSFSSVCPSVKGRHCGLCSASWILGTTLPQQSCPLGATSAWVPWSLSVRTTTFSLSESGVLVRTMQCWDSSWT